MEPYIVVPKRNNPNVEEVYTSPPGYEYDNLEGGGDPSDGTKKLRNEEGVGIPQGQGQLIGGGVFLYNHADNTPLGSFTFDTLTNQLNAKARLYFDPIIKFVSDIAVKTGTGVDQMLISPERPLVNVRATSVKDLLEGSKVPMDTLVRLLSDLLQGILQTLAVPPMVSGEKPFDDTEDYVEIKKEKIESELIKHRDALLACSVQPQLIGPDMVGGGRDNAQPVVVNIVNDLIDLFRRSAMVGNQPDKMVEAIAIVKPEVVASIETAYEDIRRISSSHSSFTLWHLMTSPSVRHNFAAMISGMLNAAPSEIQYPHYQRSVRDNGAVTGARVSTGLWTQVRGSKLYKEKLMWFRSVHYGTSTAWRDAQNRGPELKQIISQHRLSLRQNLVHLKQILFESPTSIWEQIRGSDGNVYRRSLVELYEAQKLVDSERSHLNREREMYGQMQKEGRSPIELAQREIVVRGAQARLTGAENQRDALSRTVRELSNAPATSTAWTQALYLDGYVLAQLLPRGLMDNVDRLDTKTFVTVLENKLIPKMLVVMKRMETWNGQDIESIRLAIQAVIDTSRSILRDERSLRLEVQKLDNVLRAQHEFTEDDKRELFYTSSGEIKPLVDYLQPISIYATI